jgi:hypothetical protein
MSYGIRIVQREGTLTLNVDPPPDGAWLQSYDPEAHFGLGEASWTMDPAKAMLFVTPTAALDCWNQVPMTRPTRPDGKPNRPITAYTV